MKKESSSERQTDTLNRCLNAGVRGLSKKVCPDKKQFTYKEKNTGLERKFSESHVVDVTHILEDMIQQGLDMDCTESLARQHRLDEEQEEDRTEALDTLESYEVFVDNTYMERFGTSTPKVETLSPYQELVRLWIDEFEQTFNISSLSINAEEAVTNTLDQVHVVRKELTETRQDAAIDSDAASIKGMQIKVEASPRENMTKYALKFPSVIPCVIFRTEANRGHVT